VQEIAFQCTLSRFVLCLIFSQAIVAIVVLGLVPFGASVDAFNGDRLLLYAIRILIPRSSSSTNKPPKASPPTMVATVYIIVAEMAAPITYNYWTVMCLDISKIITRIAAIAFQASLKGGNVSWIKGLKGQEST
jgi:hypothetical protein